MITITKYRPRRTKSKKKSKSLTAFVVLPYSSTICEFGALTVQVHNSSGSHYAINQKIS